MSEQPKVTTQLEEEVGLEPRSSDSQPRLSKNRVSCRVLPLCSCLPHCLVSSWLPEQLVGTGLGSTAHSATVLLAWGGTGLGPGLGNLKR